MCQERDGPRGPEAGRRAVARRDPSTGLVAQRRVRVHDRGRLAGSVRLRVGFVQARRGHPGAERRRIGSVRGAPQSLRIPCRLLVAVVGVGLGACGGDEEPPAPAPSEEREAPAAPVVRRETRSEAPPVSVPVRPRAERLVSPFPLSRELRRDEIARDRAARQAAMFAVYATARGLPDFALPPEQRPISPQEAAAILRHDAERSLPGELRRRLAIVRLTRAGLRIERGSEPGEYETRLLHRRFLAQLGAPVAAIEQVIDLTVDEITQAVPTIALEELIALVAKALGGRLFSLFDSVAGSACAYPYRNLETKVHEDVSEAGSACTRPSGASSSCPLPSDWKDNLVWVTTALDVKRPLDELAKIVDFQNLDSSEECSPYFEATCALDEANACLTCPPEPGTDWSGPLWEFFDATWNPSPDPVLGAACQCGTPSCEASFKNVLRIESLRDPDPPAQPTDHEVRYCLDRNTSAMWECNASGSLDVDEGCVVLESLDDGFVSIRAEKMLRFSGWKDTAGYPVDDAIAWNVSVLLETMGDQILVALCCPVPEDPGCLDMLVGPDTPTGPSPPPPPFPPFPPILIPPTVLPPLPPGPRPDPPF